MDKIEKAKKILKEQKQDHIIVKNEQIASQILDIDFKELNSLYSKIDEEIEFTDIKPVKAINPDKLSQEEIEKYIRDGEKTIKEKKFAVVVMAGGQGTRLGHFGPKGTYKVKINNEDKYLFEIIINKLSKAQKQYQVTIPCYIMTSPENHNETIQFLEGMNYFGYPEEHIKCFKQEELPLIDENGKLFMGEDGKIKLASNGNGGIFYSMKKNKVIDDMKKRNVEWVFIGSVDNLLTKFVDTLLLGLTINEKTNIGTRTITKKHPHEKVGVICKQNDRIQVVEYTEIPKEMLEVVDESGEMLFRRITYYV